MKANLVHLRDGSSATLFQGNDGRWACPVCGSVELCAEPYFGEGLVSFEMCNCGFEFGFDDDPGASGDAVASVQENWMRWRKRFLARFRHDPAALAQVVDRLRAIGVPQGELHAP